MSGETLSAHFPEDLKHRLTQFSNDHDINVSQAIQRTCDRGLLAYGYTNGGNQPAQTRLARAARQLASATVGAAAVLLVLGFLRAWVLAQFVPPLLAAAAGLMMVVYWEPRITLRLASNGRRLATILGVSE